MRIMTWSHASYDNYFTNMGAFFSRYMKEAIKAYYHRFDEVIVLSDGDEKEFKEKHHLPARRIYNPNTMKPDGKSSLTSKTFVYVGALSRQKGLIWPSARSADSLKRTRNGISIFMGMAR